MKNHLKKLPAILLVSILIIMKSSGQDYQISFAIIGTDETPETVVVENLDQHTELNMTGDDILHLKDQFTGSIHSKGDQRYFKVYPNPATEKVVIEFYQARDSEVRLEVTSTVGRKVISRCEKVPAGYNAFSLSGLSAGIYVAHLSFQDAEETLSAVIISRFNAQSRPVAVLHQHAISGQLIGTDHKKSISAESEIIEMQYNSGEHLRFTGTFMDASDTIDDYVATQSETVSFLYEYEVTFTVSDTVSGPISGALIDVSGQPLNTNDEGVARIMLPNNTYSYSVSASGYHAIADGNFTVNNEEVDVNITMSKISYLLTFSVSDDSTPIQDAMIEVDSDTIFTDPEGLAAIFLIPGTYHYVISASGYCENVVGDVTITDDAVIVPVAMTDSGNAVTFIVTHEGIAIDSAEIVIGGQKIYTNEEGIVSICLANGLYAYRVKADGYNIFFVRELIVDNEDIVLEIELEKRAYDVNFIVQDDSEPVAGAVISIDDQQLIADAGGKANIRLIDGDYPYTVFAPGYEPILDGLVSVRGERVDEAVVLTPKPSTVVFNVTVSHGTAPISDATILINGETLITGSAGTASIGLFMGSYPYSVTAADYIDIVDGTLTVIGVDTVIDVKMSLPDMSDIIGNTYRTVKIGDQIWMAENLKTTKYKDGTNIPLKTANTSWTDPNPNPAYCWYNNDQAFSASNSYGALYNWHAVNTGKLCPAGWHVPSQDEWFTLIETVPGYGTEASRLKAIEGWNPPGYWTSYTDEFGFSALPGGYRTDTNASFGGAGNSGFWWTANPSADYQSRAFNMQYNSPVVGNSSLGQWRGHSVRCVKN